MPRNVTQRASDNGGRVMAASELQALIEPGLSLSSWEDAEHLFRARREALVPVDQPLVLVSQLQRSGGTLLNSLLDGHPELHVHPYELHIGHPTRYRWPRLDLATDPEAWLAVLSEPLVMRLFGTGYDKRTLRSDASTPLPFTVVPSFLERLFRVLCAEREMSAPRDIISCYLTAFFNAWLDYQGLREEPKRWVTGFTPRLAWGKSRGRFFEDYPDGRLIACLRDPRGWYASASRAAPRYRRLDAAMALWQQGAREIAAAKREAPDRVLVLQFESLVRRPKRTMKAVANWLGLTWDPVLIEPTFNRLPTLANSSFRVTDSGVLAEPADRWQRALKPEVIEKIEGKSLDLYAEVAALADLTRGEPAVR